MDEDELAEYIEQSESLIASSPQMDEQNTRRKLIEPLLELLGWNMISPDVELEYSVQMGAGTKKVDYALMIEETPVVFVEAKGADSSVTDSHRNQLKSYMRQTGVDWGLLTNGKTFEILKRRTEGQRPDEVSLGTFDLEELAEHQRLLRTLSKQSIIEGESESIAERIEATRKAATVLRENKAQITEEISQLITREVGESVSQTVEAGAKQFVDSLASSLEQQETTVEISSEGADIVYGPEQTDREGISESEGDAVAGTVPRRALEGSDQDQVAVFPTKKSGVEFLKENNGWGFVRIGRNPEFVAMYVSEDVQEVRYVGRVKEIVPATQADLARPLEAYSEAASADVQAGFDPDKMVIIFEEDSLFKLEDPIPFNTDWPQSLRYTTLKDLKKAETTDDIL